MIDDYNWNMRSRPRGPKTRVLGAEIDCSQTPGGGFFAWLYLACGHRTSTCRDRKHVIEAGAYAVVGHRLTGGQPDMGRPIAVDRWRGPEKCCLDCFYGIRRYFEPVPEETLP